MSFNFRTPRVGYQCYHDLSKSPREQGAEAGPPHVIV